jgi:hypothetical protein
LKQLNAEGTLDLGLTMLMSIVEGRQILVEAIDGVQTDSVGMRQRIIISPLKYNIITVRPKTNNNMTQKENIQKQKNSRTSKISTYVSPGTSQSPVVHVGMIPTPSGVSHAHRVRRIRSEDAGGTHEVDQVTQTIRQTVTGKALQLAEIHTGSTGQHTVVVLRGEEHDQRQISNLAGSSATDLPMDLKEPNPMLQFHPRQTENLLRTSSSFRMVGRELSLVLPVLHAEP